MNGLMATLLGLLAFGIIMNIIAYVDWRRRSRMAHSSR